MARRLLVATVLLLQAWLAQGQLLYMYDFDTATNFATQTWMTISPPAYPLVTFGPFDTGGPPHGNVLKVTVDASNQTTSWYACWQGSPVRLPLTNCLPANSFLKFDLLAGLVRPVHVRLAFCGSDCRDSDTDVMPAAAGVFQTFLVPVRTFTNTDYVMGGQGFSPLPTCFEFGIHGDPVDPEGAWPCVATNFFMIDNIEYICSPPLSIAAAGNAMVISWPTNTQGFLLQQAANANSGPWTPVTNACTISDGQNQMVVSPSAGAWYYRLVGP